MRRGSLIQLFVIIVIVIAATVGLYQPIRNHINLGLDLQGGLHVVMEAVDAPDNPVSSDKVDGALNIIRTRVDQLGVKEPIVQKQGDRRIIVELAGIQDPQEAIRVIGKTALLEFKDPDGNTVLYGSELKDAKSNIDPQTNKPEVNLEFTEKGTQLFGNLTSQNVGKVIPVVLDNELISAPVVNEPITGGKARISGGYQTLEEAEHDAIMFRSGSLPVKLEMVEKRTVGPTLGADSLKKSMEAGIIGIIVVFIFMLAFYRLPGVIADFSLLLYTLIVMGVLALINTSLTLPGIAGIILSIGMAVDANIIIYERMKEELRTGKTLMAAIDAGFARAFWTIFDSQLTTLIGAGVLFFLGTGPIKGFAVTLSIGIVVNLFTSITFTRYMLRLIARSKAVTNLKFYGV
ncbi:MAG: protein translocase subunit SecD [Firmicutes bacterium]|nr:protein translocase subunit SecD [Bacillota bacterium]